MTKRKPLAEVPIEGRKVVLVVAPLEYRDEELEEPLKKLHAAGATTAIASTRTGPCKGMLGGTVEATLSTADLDPEAWDLVVIVGGVGSPEHLWTDEPLLRFVKAMKSAGKPMAAICLSSPVLAKAGALRGLRATVWGEPSAIDALEKNGATYEKAPVVRDGTVVTAEGPHAAGAFADAIVEQLFGPRNVA